MLKKIPVSELMPGMFIHDLDLAWRHHPFMRSQFVASREDVDRVRALGIATVVIDGAKGRDLVGAPTVAQAEAARENRLVEIARPSACAPRIPLEQELGQAAAIRRQARALVAEVMRDARLGKALELGRISDVVEDVTASILRNASALVGLARIKAKDDYTFIHSVSVCTLLVAFCRSHGMDDEVVYQAGIGGLLHDTGKALVPDAILGKPGRLTEEEFDVIRRHPQDGHDILREMQGIGPIPLDIALNHHERYDGTGYPGRQGRGQVSELAQMAAIVDVYDALTADRCYHQAMLPAQALRAMLEQAGTHLHPTLTQAFIRCVGIYPVGTLVQLESGRLGVVAEPHETNLLTPKVNVFFHSRSRTYIKPETVDLGRSAGHGGADRIIAAEQPEKWRIDPMRFLVLA